MNKTKLKLRNTMKKYITTEKAIAQCNEKDSYSFGISQYISELVLYQSLCSQRIRC